MKPLGLELMLRYYYITKNYSKHQHPIAKPHFSKYRENKKIDAFIRGKAKVGRWAVGYNYSVNTENARCLA